MKIYNLIRGRRSLCTMMTFMMVYLLLPTNITFASNGTDSMSESIKETEVVVKDNDAGMQQGIEISLAPAVGDVSNSTELQTAITNVTTEETTEEEAENFNGIELNMSTFDLLDATPLVLDSLSDGQSGVGYAVNNGILTISGVGSYEISGSGKQILVDVPGGTVDIKLNGVNIDVSGSSGKCAFEIADGTTVNMYLEGTNVLKSGATRAGLEAYQGTTLTINGTGKLTAIGMGTNGAGIGGGSSAAQKKHAGTITIGDSVEITATGGNNAPGIGGSGNC